MVSKNVKINPEFMSSYYNLKNACSDFNTIKSKYGKDSDEYKNAFKRRQIAETIYTNTKGLTNDNSQNALCENDAHSLLKSYTNNVHSWYA